MRFAIGIDHVGVGILLGAKSEIDTLIVRIDRNTKRVDLMLKRLPARRHDDFTVRSVISIVINNQREFSDNRQKNSAAMRIFRRSQRHANWLLGPPVALP